jgi:hypothetical protein
MSGSQNLFIMGTWVMIGHAICRNDENDEEEKVRWHESFN